MYSLLENLDFPPGLYDKKFSVLREKGVEMLMNYFEGEEWRTYSGILQEQNLAN